MYYKMCFYGNSIKVEITVGWSGSGKSGQDSPEDGVSKLGLERL